VSCSTPSGGPTMTKLVRATAKEGIIFLYGALSTEPNFLACSGSPEPVAHDSRIID